MPPDTIRTAEDETRYLRGIERPAEGGSESARKVVNALLFLPRVAVGGAIYLTAQTVNVVDNSKIVQRSRAFFFGDDKDLIWYPVFAGGGGAGPGVGVGISYRKGEYTATASGAYGGTERFGGGLILTRDIVTAKALWRFHLSGVVGKRPDLQFYGFGGDPINDPRNPFGPNATARFGIYKQRLTKVQFIAGVRPAAQWEFFTTSFFVDRDLEVPSSPDGANIDQTFDLTGIPGFQGTSGQVRQVYNELAIRLDTRPQREQLSPGFRAEAYGGYSFGAGGDKSRFFRAGLDAAGYVPLIRGTRLLVPRVVVDVVESANDAPIPFTEFPRHLTFRGTNPRTILRTDFVMVQPSLEYQWPLAHNLRAHVFVDYLLVAPRFAELTFTDAPYAYGVGIDLHGASREVARLTFANGSEGFRIFLTIGLTTHTSERSKWR